MMGYRTWVCDNLEEDIKLLHRGMRVEPRKDTLADRTTKEYMESAFTMPETTPRLRASYAMMAVMNAAEDGRDVRDLIGILDDYCAEHGVCLKKEEKNA